MIGEFKGKNKLKTPKPSSCVKLKMDGTFEDVKNCFQDSDWLSMQRYSGEFPLHSPYFDYNLSLFINHDADRTHAKNELAHEIIDIYYGNDWYERVELCGTVFVYNYNNAGERIDFTVADLSKFKQTVKDLTG